MDLNDEAANGIMLAEVVEDGPAEAAGLVAAREKEIDGKTVYVNGDIIVGADGETMYTTNEIIAYVNTKKPGDVIGLMIYRDGEEMTVDVELGVRPE
jgi:S1-C subfamily serine protease